MTKLRTIDAVVNAMIANPNATTYDFTVGRDSAGEYIEKRSKIASKFRQWRGKHINIVGDSAKARYNRDKVVINDFQVAKLMQHFARKTEAHHPLHLFGSREAKTLLTSQKAADNTFFKVRHAVRNETVSRALAHYEIMVRLLEAGRRPKVESAASLGEVFGKLNERWNVRADDAASNVGSVASELERLGTNPSNVWLGNANLEEIEHENEDLNDQLAHGPQVEEPDAIVTSSLFREENRQAPVKTPAGFHAHIYNDAMKITLLKDSLKYETGEEKQSVENKIVARTQDLFGRTTDFINEHFKPVPKGGREALEAYIAQLDPFLQQYEEKIIELEASINFLNADEDETVIQMNRILVEQVASARDQLRDRLEVAHNDLRKLPIAHRSLSLRPSIRLQDVHGNQNPFGKLPRAQELMNLLEFSRDRGQTINPGTEALAALEILTEERINAPKVRTALALFVDGLGIQPKSDTGIRPLASLVDNYEKYICPTYLSAKREIAKLNQEIVNNLSKTGRLTSQYSGKAALDQKPWEMGLLIKLQGPHGAETHIPCGIQADGSFIMPGKNATLLKYELPEELSRRAINLHIYQDQLTKKVADVRREFTRGIKGALAPNAAEPDHDRFLEAYTYHKTKETLPRTINLSLLATTEIRDIEESMMKATNYAHDQKLANNPRTIASLVEDRLLNEDSAEKVKESFLAYAKSRFFTAVDVKAARYSYLGGDISETDVKMVADGLAQDYTASLATLHRKQASAKQKLDAADDEMGKSYSRRGLNHTVSEQVDTAMLEYELLQTKIELADKLKAHAIELKEHPELFWNRT